MTLPKPVRAPIKDRASILFVERGQLDVIDGVLVLIDKLGVRMQLPIGAIACLMLEPGTRVSHRAVQLAGQVGCLLVWVGEGGVRVYSAGLMSTHRADRLLQQARAALDEPLRLAVVRKMYALRFGQDVPPHMDVDQLRGLEGARVKKMYVELADKAGFEWRGRSYDPSNHEAGDLPNRCLSVANSCLYGLTHAAILAAGYSPAIGFIHTGKPQSFVYDVADIMKFDTVVPTAFRVAQSRPSNPERAVRQACRDSFRQSKLLDKIIPLINDLLDTAGPRMTSLREGEIAPYLPEDDPFADVDHRD